MRLLGLVIGSPQTLSHKEPGMPLGLRDGPHGVASARGVKVAAPERKNLEASAGVSMMPLGLGHRMVSLQGLLAIVVRPQCPKRGS